MTLVLDKVSGIFTDILPLSEGHLGALLLLLTVG
jgi:hypothetical protein